MCADDLPTLYYALEDGEPILQHPLITLYPKHLRCPDPAAVIMGLYRSDLNTQRSGQLTFTRVEGRIRGQVEAKSLRFQFWVDMSSYLSPTGTSVAPLPESTTLLNGYARYYPDHEYQAMGEYTIEIELHSPIRDSSHGRPPVLSVSIDRQTLDWIHTHQQGEPRDFHMPNNGDIIFNYLINTGVVMDCPALKKKVLVHVGRELE